MNELSDRTGSPIHQAFVTLDAKAVNRLAADLAPHHEEIFETWERSLERTLGERFERCRGPLRQELDTLWTAMADPALSRVFEQLDGTGEECARRGVSHADVLFSIQAFKEACMEILRKVHGDDVGALVKRWTLLDRVMQALTIRLAEAFVDGYLLQVREKNEELLAAREQHSRQLVRAEKLAALGQLAAGVAHELNNPLATMANRIEDMLDLCRETPGPSTARTADFLHNLESVKNQIHRCKRITQDMLDLARTRAPQVEDVDLGTIVKKVVDIAAAYRGQDHPTIRVRIEPSLEPVRSDPFQLDQIFMNILRNALDAVGSKGTIDVSVKRNDHMMLVEVCDDGIGIPPEHIDRVFDPFFTTKPVGKGTGLGLAICYSLLQKLGGEISLVSTPGMGTTVRVSLPLEVKEA